MKLSMGSWSFAFGPFAGSPKTMEEIASRLSAAGFDGIELNGYPPHVTLEKYGTAEARAGLRRMLDGYGLGISGYSSDLGAHSPTVAGNRKSYVEEFQRQVELCHELGCPMIRVDSSTAPGSVPDEEYEAAFHRLAETWRECADHARQAQVLMTWEFEPGFLINKPSEVLKMHTLVGHPWFRVMFDTAHAYMCGVVGARQHGEPEVLEGGVVELLEKLHDTIGAVHVIDSDGTLYCDETSTHVPIGQGLIDWEKTAPKLRALSRIEWWCVDLCFCAEAWEKVEESLAAARALFEVPMR
ncbi:MAG: sugar phosphate isomerase/epimerase [Acidobacteria bacterium]|nr:sugar phosphate isomerase/epimerase [Acidobacteriota bacterium]